MTDTETCEVSDEIMVWDDLAVDEITDVVITTDSIFVSLGGVDNTADVAMSTGAVAEGGEGDKLWTFLVPGGGREALISL